MQQFRLYAYAFLATFCVVGVPAASAATLQSVCPPAVIFDSKLKIDAKTSLSLLTKILNELGLSGSHEQDVQARLPTTDDRVGALQAMGIVCRWLDNDPTIPTEKKIAIFTNWYLAVATYSPKKASLNSGRKSGAFGKLQAILIAADSDSGLSAALLSPPPPPPRGAPMLKVFPKSNLGIEKILELRKALPGFDIRQGRSGLSGSRYPAEVLFVDRQYVSEQDVLQVLRALLKLGVDIKSVQQSTLFGRAEMQVGTIVPTPGHPAFASSSSLNLQELASLSGNDFWKAALNGQAWCNTGVGRTVRCYISSDGRPSLSRQP